MISTSPKKEKEALNTLKADHFVVSKDEAQMSVCAFAAVLLLLCSQLQIHTVLCSDISTLPMTQYCFKSRAPSFGIEDPLRLRKT